MNTEMSFLIAFTAGSLSFLSPCVLPLIPSYLSLLIGDFAEQKGKSQILIPALTFILGFSIVFILLGMSASYLGQILLGNLKIIRQISGTLVIILGLHLMGILKIPALYREKRLPLGSSINKYLRPLIMGFALAIAWTPCIGPILSSILIYAGNSGTILQGAILLAFYSAGFALPFLVTALFFNWVLPKLNKIKPYLSSIQKITGLFLVILGLLITFNYIQIFSQL